MAAMMILDPETRRDPLRRRRRMGGDRWDEVRDGVYTLMPLGDNVHQHLGYQLTSAPDLACKAAFPGLLAFPGCKISDRPDEWKKNYRCPDVAVFLPGNPAQDRGTHWLGGPDFAAEIVSGGDRARKKFDFYAKVGVRELLFVDRQPWRLELFGRRDKAFVPAGTSDLAASNSLSSTILPVTPRLAPGPSRPQIEVIRTTDGQRWLA
jgi:hypothetical protein